MPSIVRARYKRLAQQKPLPLLHCRSKRMCNWEERAGPRIHLSLIITTITAHMTLLRCKERCLSSFSINPAHTRQACWQMAAFGVNHTRAAGMLVLFLERERIPEDVSNSGRSTRAPPLSGPWLAVCIFSAVSPSLKSCHCFMQTAQSMHAQLGLHKREAERRDRWSQTCNN